MVPVEATEVTGPIRATMPCAVVGSSGCCPDKVLDGCTVARFPSSPSCASRLAFDVWEMPSTPTIAAIPMLIPSADSAARIRRDRRPRLPVRSRSGPVSFDPPPSPARGRAGWVSRTGVRVIGDPPVTNLDPPPHRRGDLQVVGDAHDRGSLGVQLAQQAQDRRAGGRI